MKDLKRTWADQRALVYKLKKKTKKEQDKERGHITLQIMKRTRKTTIRISCKTRMLFKIICF